ncbi:MAG: hypothetical protein KF743_14080 [Fimbriimonadaceae bacterium]|nr:hypothetical protein [Fimbriimonadaceae bacterium]
MRKLSFLCSLALIAGLTVLLGRPLIGQPVVNYEPFVPTPEYRAIQDMINDGKPDTARAAFLALADKYPGTTLSGVCLNQAALWSERGEAQAIYERMRSSFPNSRFEIYARHSLLDLQYGPNAAVWRAAADQLAQSYGGPSLQTILAGDHLNTMSEQIWALPQEYQMGLYSLYSEMCGSLSFTGGRYQEALPMAQFMRQTFWKFETRSDQMAWEMELIWMRANGVKPSEYKHVSVNPTIRLRPRKNGVFGPRPRFTLELSTGPLPLNQVSLSQSRILLDGLDFKPSMKLRSYADLRPKKKKDSNKPFEVLRLSGRPAQPLSPGSHTLSLVIVVSGYSGTGPGKTTLDFPFRVTGPRDDDDDDCDDDRWDRDW